MGKIKEAALSFSHILTCSPINFPLPKEMQEKNVHVNVSLQIKSIT